MSMRVDHILHFPFSRRLRSCAQSNGHVSETAAPNQHRFHPNSNMCFYYKEVQSRVRFPIPVTLIQDLPVEILSSVTRPFDRSIIKSEFLAKVWLICSRLTPRSGRG